MESRDYFIIAALLTAGTVLRFILVLFGEPYTPNILVAFYGLAIMAIGLSFGQSLIIGLVAGMIAALISSSVINPGFLISEPVGAVVCLGVFLSLPHSRPGAALSVFSATLASGIVFSALALSFGVSSIAAAFPDPWSFMFAILIPILITAVINAIIAGLLYPRVRAFRNHGQDRQGLYSFP